MIASFIKEFEGLNIKKIQALTPDDRDKLKGMEYVAEETRYNRYYKRPAFGLHSYVEQKDVVYFHVDGCARDFLYRFAASMKAASMMVTRMNHMHLSRCILCVGGVCATFFFYVFRTLLRAFMHARSN